MSLLFLHLKFYSALHMTLHNLCLLTPPASTFSFISQTTRSSFISHSCFSYELHVFHCSVLLPPKPSMHFVDNGIHEDGLILCGVELSFPFFNRSTFTLLTLLRCNFRKLPIAKQLYRQCHTFKLYRNFLSMISFRILKLHIILSQCYANAVSPQ